MIKSAPFLRVIAALLERPDASGKFDDDVAYARLDSLEFPEASCIPAAGVTRADVRVVTSDLNVGGEMVCEATLDRRDVDMLTERNGLESVGPAKRPRMRRSCLVPI
jgi:hypothetical protein